VSSSLRVLLLAGSNSSPLSPVTIALRQHSNMRISAEGGLQRLQKFSVTTPLLPHFTLNTVPPSTAALTNAMYGSASVYHAQAVAVHKAKVCACT
jgi:hypothetical protein